MEGYFERVFSHFTEEELQQYLNFQEKFYAAILEEGKTIKKKRRIKMRFFKISKGICQWYLQ